MPVRKIKDISFDLVRQNGVERRLIKGIGIGIPGPVTYSLSRPASLSLMPGWDRFPIMDLWKQHDVLLAAVRQAVYRRSLPIATRNLVIQHSALGPEAGFIGATALTLDDAIQYAFKTAS